MQSRIDCETPARQWFDTGRRNTWHSVLFYKTLQCDIFVRRTGIQCQCRRWAPCPCMHHVDRLSDSGSCGSAGRLGTSYVSVCHLEKQNRIIGHKVRVILKYRINSWPSWSKTLGMECKRIRFTPNALFSIKKNFPCMPKSKWLT